MPGPAGVFVMEILVIVIKLPMQRHACHHSIMCVTCATPSWQGQHGQCLHSPSVMCSCEGVVDVQHTIFEEVDRWLCRHTGNYSALPSRRAPQNRGIASTHHSPTPAVFHMQAVQPGSQQRHCSPNLLTTMCCNNIGTLSIGAASRESKQVQKNAPVHQQLEPC